MDRANLYREFEKLFAGNDCNLSEADYEAFEPKKKLLIQLSEVENSSMSLYDMHKREYAFVRSKFDTQMNYSFNNYFKKQPSYFFELMPLPDIGFALDTMKKSFAFLDQQKKDKLKEYKLIFEYRLSDAAGNLYRFLQQCIVLEQDKNGNIWLVLILNDLIPDIPGGPVLKRKIIHIPTGKICLFQEESPGTGKFISRRETEILGLISQGLQSKEIAGRLFVSVNTVNNHRQKIIEKLNVENTHEALSYAKAIGII